MRLTTTAPLFALLLTIGCGENGQQTPSTPSTGTPGQPAAPANATADDWHNTDTLFTIMGGVQGKVVADLFAGDGYYTWKLIDAGARVIAIDDDAGSIAALEQEKKARGIGDDRLLLRVTPAGTPGLLANEADMALCTRPYLTINDRQAFFTQVRQGLKPPRRVFIVDFLAEQTPVGPPMDQRAGQEMVMGEMSTFGFTDIGAYSKTLPYRFVLFAQDFQEVNE